MPRDRIARIVAVLAVGAAVTTGCGLITGVGDLHEVDGTDAATATSSSSGANGSSSGSSGTGSSSSGSPDDSGVSQVDGGTDSGNGVDSGRPTPIALVQTASQAGASTLEVDVDFKSANTAGNLIVIYARSAGGNSSPSINDSAGNVYNEAVSKLQPVNGGSHMSSIYFAANIKGGANKVKLSYPTANNFPYLAIFEYRGLHPDSPLDRTASDIGTTATASSSATTSTTVGAELVFAGLGLPHNSTTAVTAGPGFALREQDATSARAATEDQIVSTTAAYAGVFGLSVTDSWSAVVATFR
jgi:hypothetical protein